MSRAVPLGRSLRVLVAIVVPPHLSVSGGARAAEQLSAALAPYCDITVASMLNGVGAGTLSEPEGRFPARISVRTWLPGIVPWSRFPSRYSTLFYRSDIPDIIRRGGYDLVHIHNPMPALEMERVARACTEMRIPYVVSTHGFNEVANGLDIYGFDFLRRQVWRRLVLEPVSRVVRKAAAMFVLSPADVSIVRDMGFTGEPITVTNGVPMPQPGDAVADREALERLGIPFGRTEGQITCMFLANHTPNKGLPVLLDAFSRTTRPFLLVIGGDKRGGVDYERALAACKPGQRIVVTGRLSDAEVGALFRRSDLFVFPTLADTFPLSVLEAMAQGLPVLATNVGGIPFQLSGDCGELVPPGDPAALAAAVEALAADSLRLAAMGNRARAKVASAFSWEAAAASAWAGYQAVLAD